MGTINDKKIKFNEQGVVYKKGFKWYELSFSDIVGAYLRIEEVPARLCCCVANFDMHFLMLRTKSSELIKVEGSSRERVQDMLAELKERNPEIEIGYKKPEAE